MSWKHLIKIAGVLTAAWAMSSIARAGTTSSGGGLIFGDEINPWFLENVYQVSYCLDLDEANFGVAAGEARHIVGTVLKDWKDIFAKNAWTKLYPPDELQPYGNIHLATQGFVEEPCSPSTDLRFQFGTLTTDQIHKYSIQPQTTVAVTVRTQYDEVHLRGKGFIYIGPQKGPLHFASSATVQDPWSYCNGCLLRMVLTHELGHVFGLRHAGNSENLMDEKFVDTITQSSFVVQVQRNQLWSSVMKYFEAGKNIFSASANFELIRCDQPLTGEPVLAKFLGVKQQTLCIKAELRDQDTLVLYRAETEEGPFVEVGYTTPNIGSTHWDTTSLIQVRLNQQQQVFTKFPKEQNGNLLGPERQVRGKRNVDFIFADGSKRAISYTIKPGNGLDIIGAVDGQIFVYDATP